MSPVSYFHYWHCCPFGLDISYYLTPLNKIYHRVMLICSLKHLLNSTISLQLFHHHSCQVTAISFLHVWCKVFLNRCYLFSPACPHCHPPKLSEWPSWYSDDVTPHFTLCDRFPLLLWRRTSPYTWPTVSPIVCCTCLSKLSSPPTCPHHLCHVPPCHRAFA